VIEKAHQYIRAILDEYALPGQVLVRVAERDPVDRAEDHRGLPRHGFQLPSLAESHMPWRSPENTGKRAQMT